MKLIFITAGVGGSNFEDAADRLTSTISKFGVFDSIQIFKTPDVEKYAPEILDWYQPEQLKALKGYGWYVWKSRFAKHIISRDFEDSDIIMYLDAGCEAFLSAFSKKRLLRYVDIARKDGACLFKIPTPEWQYTKKLVLDRFQGSVKVLDGYQFQSGSWLMRGEVARKFIEMWDSIVWEDQRFTDESPSPDGERLDFVCNRYDQAIFSMVARTFSLNDCGDIPPGDISGIKPRVRLFLYPFAWARNRTGQSLITPGMLLLGKLSIIPTLFFKKLNRKA
jgi:hypothetical protein